MDESGWHGKWTLRASTTSNVTIVLCGSVIRREHKSYLINSYTLIGAQGWMNS
jgi:hypothetical protein